MPGLGRAEARPSVGRQCPGMTKSRTRGGYFSRSEGLEWIGTSNGPIVLWR